MNNHSCGKAENKADSVAVCSVSQIHRERLAAVLGEMKPEVTMRRVAETFKVLGDPTRVKIVFALSLAELCVCDIAEITGMTPSAISHQLRVLRNMRLVKYRREGKMVFYSLDDEHIKTLFYECLEHAEEDGSS